MIDIRTTPIDLATFKSITNSNGVFETWTDIINRAKDDLPINAQILGSVLKSVEEVTGDNIVFNNLENKNIYYFNDDVTKDNNSITQNKMVMMLYTDYMLPLEFNMIDQKSAIAWSTFISDAVSSMMVARQDITNLTVIDEINDLNIARGQVHILGDCDGDAPIVNGTWDYSGFKNLGAKLSKIRINAMYKRTKFSKGYNSSEVDFLISPMLSINLLNAITYNTAAPQAYDDFKDEFTITRINNFNYKTTLYLGQDVGMSEATINGALQNAGQNTGNLLKNYDFDNLQGLLVFRRSIAFFGHNYGERTLPKVGSRLIEVMSIVFRMNAGVKPVYASFNKSFFKAIPTKSSYIKTDGTVVPAKDYSKASDFNGLRNELYARQPQMYNEFFPVASNLTQAEVDKIWEDAIVNWKLPVAKKQDDRSNAKK